MLHNMPLHLTITRILLWRSPVISSSCGDRLSRPPHEKSKKHQVLIRVSNVVVGKADHHYCAAEVLPHSKSACFLVPSVSLGMPSWDSGSGSIQAVNLAFNMSLNTSGARVSKCISQPESGNQEKAKIHLFCVLWWLSPAFGGGQPRHLNV